MHHVERAIFDLRRGVPVLIESDEGDRLIAVMRHNFDIKRDFGRLAGMLSCSAVQQELDLLQNEL